MKKILAIFTLSLILLTGCSSEGHTITQTTGTISQVTDTTYTVKCDEYSQTFNKTNGQVYEENKTINVWLDETGYISLADPRLF